MAVRAMRDFGPAGGAAVSRGRRHGHAGPHRVANPGALGTEAGKTRLPLQLNRRRDSYIVDNVVYFGSPDQIAVDLAGC